MAHQALKPKCPQCGGPVEVPEGAAYARCRYCSAESFVDLSGAILHQVIQASVGRARVPGLLRARALAAGWPEATIADLDLVYEPVWEMESPDGRRLQVSARPGPQGRFAEVKLPGGERAFVEPGARDAAAEWLEPELAPESVPEVAARVTGRPLAVKTIRLIHHPLYRGKVQVAGSRHEFQLDAVTGELTDVDWPEQSTHRRRNQAWVATALMVVAAALLPLPIAAVAVVVLGGLTARTFFQKGGTPAGARG